MALDSRKRKRGAAAEPAADSDLSPQPTEVLPPVRDSNDDIFAADADEQPDQKRQQQRRSLFVRGLPANTTTDSLVEHFSADFPIKHGHAVVDPTTKTCKGYGFVAFADADDAARALTELDGSDFNGRKLRLEVAEPRKRDADDTLPEEMRRKSRHNATAVELKERRRLRLSADQKERQPPKLIIRNLPWSIKEPDQLAQLFLPYGKVQFATLPKKGPKTLAGFGFVMLRGHKNAETAIEGVNGKEIDGRKLAVDWAVDKTTWDNLAKKDVDQPEETDDVADVGIRLDEGDGDSEAEDEDEDASANGDEGADFIALSDDDEDEDADASEDGEDASIKEPADDEEDRSATVFVRNVAFTTTDDDLYDHFRRLAPVRYARIVIDHETERPRGTAFVCFRSAEDAKKVLTNAPRDTAAGAGSSGKDTKGRDSRPTHSVLQSETADPSGAYTLAGRVLLLAPAVARATAATLTEEGQQKRTRDKRRLYLLNEGTIPADSAAAAALHPSELAMRTASLSQRQSLLKRNPSLHLSLTRLSVRNAPRTLNSAGLKALAREAVVHFAEDVKAGRRARLSREELAREADEMAAAEAARRRAGKGVVRQAKIVFEGAGSGEKVDEPAAAGGGRSRGYGFVEYHTHRAALMGLRWLNGHAVPTTAAAAATGDGANGRTTRGDGDGARAKRLIVEFAIENAQVVQRRREREVRARAGGPRPSARSADDVEGDASTARDTKGDRRAGAKTRFGKKDKAKGKADRAGKGKAATTSKQTPAANREPVKAGGNSKKEGKTPDADKDKLAQRTRIIAKKRAQRRERKHAGAKKA